MELFYTNKAGLLSSIRIKYFNAMKLQWNVLNWKDHYKMKKYDKCKIEISYFELWNPGRPSTE